MSSSRLGHACDGVCNHRHAQTKHVHTRPESSLTWTHCLAGKLINEIMLCPERTNPACMRMTAHTHMLSRAQAYREGPEVLQQKLMNLMGWAPLGQRSKDAARVLYHRLEPKGRAAPGGQFFTSVLPPAPLPAAAPTP